MIARFLMHQNFLISMFQISHAFCCPKMISTNNCPPSSNSNNPNLNGSSACCCKLQWYRYSKQRADFRSPRLAARFKSNAANIAKVLVTAFYFNYLIIKFNIQEIQVVKKVKKTFSFKNSSSNEQNALR